MGRSAGGGGPGGPTSGGVAPGREPQDQPLQDSEEETADRPLAEPRGIQMQVTRRAASPVFALMCLNLSWFLCLKMSFLPMSSCWPPFSKDLRHPGKYLLRWFGV